ncbi:MAG TPA: c-type cytochrome [Candidatus Baltobacteraceae bacterium]|nr:c-type cytochrome [Candidatus Baltobacteraceae bacterium]
MDVEPVSVRVYVDEDDEPIATYRPPARVHLDTRTLADGEHVLRIEAVDAVGNVGVRRIPFVVANGPGITVTGLRAGSRVRGAIDVDVNAFSAEEPFDPGRAESPGPIPVWTWVLIVIIGVWAMWYGLEYFPTPAAFAQTPTYAANPAIAAALGAPTQGQTGTAAPVPANAAVGSKNVAGFDYSSLGAQVFSSNCASCHGDSGAGTPGVFPPLAGDSIVNGRDADAHVKIVLHGLSGKTIGGKTYAAQMPAFGAQLTDAQIAAVIDHERTSWGNNGPTITPAQVTRDR